MNLDSKPTWVISIYWSWSRYTCADKNRSIKCTGSWNIIGYLVIQTSDDSVVSISWYCLVQVSGTCTIIRNTAQYFSSIHHNSVHCGPSIKSTSDHKNTSPSAPFPLISLLFLAALLFHAIILSYTPSRQLCFHSGIKALENLQLRPWSTLHAILKYTDRRPKGSHRAITIPRMHTLPFFFFPECRNADLHILNVLYIHSQT